jgi:hypothetical protein
MEWTRSETLALAKNSCMQCHGLGLRLGRRGSMNPCNCVLRAIFRTCLTKFRHCATKEKYMSKISLEFIPGRERNLSWGRKDEEYMADFILVSRRNLSELEFQVFRFHFLLGADWKLCCWRLKIDRGNFFHSVYRIQQKLGRVFRELQPYSLYPLDEYFHGTVRAEPVCARWGAEVVRMPPGYFHRSVHAHLLRSA